MSQSTTHHVFCEQNKSPNKTNNNNKKLCQSNLKVSIKCHIVETSFFHFIPTQQQISPTSYCHSMAKLESKSTQYQAILIKGVHEHEMKLRNKKHP